MKLRIVEGEKLMGKSIEEENFETITQTCHNKGIKPTCQPDRAEQRAEKQLCHPELADLRTDGTKRIRIAKTATSDCVAKRVTGFRRSKSKTVSGSNPLLLGILARTDKTKCVV